MDVSIQEFRFNKTLQENKNAPKERIYKELLAEIKKMMISLQKGHRSFSSVINCLNLISVSEAEELVERVYALNRELRQYVRVVYETKNTFDLTVSRLDISKDPRKTYRGLPLTKLCLLLEAS